MKQHIIKNVSVLDKTTLRIDWHTVYDTRFARAELT